MVDHLSSALKITLILRRLDSQLTLNSIVVFLQVAENPGISITELSQICGFSLPTLSRVARSLGPPDVEGSLPPYLDLIEIFINPNDKRSRLLSLSDYGRQICESLNKAIEHATPIDIAP